MVSWLAARLIRRNMAAINRGDIRPLLRFDADDIRFRFPCDSSWAGELEGKADLARWLQRFADTGLQIHADQVIAQGPPWNTTLCVRGTDHLDTKDGRVYANRYVIWGRMRWGLLREYEVYEDTQASAALDAYLATA
jgi:ketosteroid isomerase-like protein